MVNAPAIHHGRITTRGSWDLGWRFTREGLDLDHHVYRDDVEGHPVGTYTELAECLTGGILVALVGGRRESSRIGYNVIPRFPLLRGYPHAYNRLECEKLSSRPASYLLVGRIEAEEYRAGAPDDFTYSNRRVASSSSCLKVTGHA